MVPDQTSGVYTVCPGPLRDARHKLFKKKPYWSILYLSMDFTPQTVWTLIRCHVLQPILLAHSVSLPMDFTLQTVWTLIRCRRMRSLIWVYTVCLLNRECLEQRVKNQPYWSILYLCQWVLLCKRTPPLPERPNVTNLSFMKVFVIKKTWMSWCLHPFQQYFSHIRMMEGWTWRGLCNEAPFRFGNNLTSNRIRTRDPVIRSQELYPLSNTDTS